jgi:hypothetical protein
VGVLVRSTGGVPYMEGKVQSDFHFSMRTWGTLLVPQVLMPFKQWNSAGIERDTHVLIYIINGKLTPDLLFRDIKKA